MGGKLKNQSRIQEYGFGLDGCQSTKFTSRLSAEEGAGRFTLNMLLIVVRLA
jgi:hypothetical protein